MAIRELPKDFKQLRQDLSTVVFDPIRVADDTRFEGVVSGGEMKKLFGLLDAFFGCAVQQSEVDSDRVRLLLENNGGLMSGQTFYCSTCAGRYLCVMLWPWQDGVHLTMKAFCG